MLEFLKDISCVASECACWIIVLMNILAVFYLVFCSFYRIRLLTRIVGWMYAGLLLIVTVGVVAHHTCIYTVLCSVFTAMIIMAILAVILPRKSESENNRAEKKHNYGCYVIHPLRDGGFYYTLHDNKKNIIAKSAENFNYLSQAKQEIADCNSVGSVDLRDSTQRLIKETEPPRFELLRIDDGFVFRLCMSETKVMLESEIFAEYKAAVLMLRKAMKAIGSEDIYLDSEYDENVIPEVNEMPESEENTEAAVDTTDNITVKPDEDVEKTPVIENGIEVIGVIWPENAGNKKSMYYYDPAGLVLNVGDRILVPTRESERMVDVSKENHFIPKETVAYPLKKVIKIIKRSMQSTDKRE